MNAAQDDLVLFNAVSKTFTARDGLHSKGTAVHAVRDLTLAVRAGETLGLVGESGSGKTTSGRMLVRLERPTSGTITFRGRDINSLRGRDMRKFRRQVQMVFQDSAESLDSRMSVGALVQEPLSALHIGERANRAARARESLAQVGLGEGHFFDRYPGQLSGGQRQRVAIARALVVEPRLIVCDEPVTALDLSVQAQILNLLLTLQETHGIGLLFIAHDMSVIRQLAHRVAVMYRGQLVELARAEEFFDSPAHPYSCALLEASLHDLHTTSRGYRLAQEDAPADQGCVLAPRCWKVQDECRLAAPPLTKVSPLHAAACFYPEGADQPNIVPASLRPENR